MEGLKVGREVVVEVEERCEVECNLMRRRDGCRSMGRDCGVEIAGSCWLLPAGGASPH